MLSDARVEVVLINYKRPQNIAQIVNAFRNQTVGCYLTLIDAAPSAEFSLPEEVRQSVDHLFTWTHEFGPYNRYVPIAVYSHEFTYFHDDDMLPGSRVIEHFTKVADSIKEFGVLGQMGRFVDATGAYIARDVRRIEHLVPVDIVVRGYFVPTKHLPAVMQLRLNLGLLPNPSLEDDLLLCTAMSMIHGLTNYISPADDDPETRMNKAGLRSAFARQGRDIHFEDRTEFCRRAIDAGWVPLSRRGDRSTQDEPNIIRPPANGPLSTGVHTNGGRVFRHRQFAPAANSAARQTVESARPLDASMGDRRGFNVNDYWLKRGQTYIDEDRLYSEPYRLQEEFIIDGLAHSEVPMQSVLEIGCGFGRITKRIAEAFPSARITAVDISPDQLRNARDYCADFADRIEFFEYDLYSGMPLPGQSYDTAIAIEVLMHHPYHAVSQFIERLTRVADSVVNYDWSEEWSGTLARHVWVHDYAEIYQNLGFSCEVLTEPQKFRGQQQRLFIATRMKAPQPIVNRSEESVIAKESDSPIEMAQHISGGTATNSPSPLTRPRRPGNAASLSMKAIEARIPSDHVRQATLESFLEAIPKTGTTIDVLDLGCGTGKSYDIVASRIPDFRWTGVDIADSPEVRSRTRTDCQFVTYDGVNLPFANESFDIILSVQVFEHVRYPEQLLREVPRVLRPGGLFVGSVSQLEPFHSNSFWNFTYYGFANVAYDAGLNLRELRPGIDGLTLIVRNILNHGFRRRVDGFAPFFKEHSPLNEWLRMTLGDKNTDVQQINKMMLRYCGHFWFVFDVPPRG